MRRYGVCRLLAMTVLASCSASSADPPAPNLSEFCTVYAGLDGEVTDIYVGSDEHLADIESLRAVAPDVIINDVTVFRDYIASGAIDSINDPESNLTENWPSEVVAATRTVQAFATDNC